MRRPTIYTASKIHNAALFRTLRMNYPEFEFTARWIDLDQHEGTATTLDFRRFWIIDVADVCRSDFVLVYANTSDEPLRGALVEAGVAIGRGIHVLAVGDARCFGSWHNHPFVERFWGLPEALDYARKFIP